MSVCTVPRDRRARRLIDYLAASIDTPYHGSSSMTSSVYDTAWLAMVTKREYDRHGELVACRWAFPRSFQAVLDSQCADGGFSGPHPGGGAGVDAILNCMAALLALCKHARLPFVTGCPPADDDLALRISRGRDFLERVLGCWDVSSTDHVGFEILVPKLLSLLKSEAGLDFSGGGVFPAYEVLMKMNARKLAKISPRELIYSSHQSTLVHSLEAFLGDLDFDKTAHHLVGGAMMNSPSSTAAYLMGCSTWDDRAEAYLQYIDNGKGLVPSAFPVSLFEISWTLTTLLEAGFTVAELGENDVRKLVDFVETQLKNGQGICGFAPNILPDADDSAKCILLLTLAGRQMDCYKMIRVFECETHFATYNHESTHSFSANCNVLKAILSSGEQSNRYTPQICKAFDYLFRTWEKGQLKDKWNLSPQYSMMLLTEVLVMALRLWDEGALADVPKELMGGMKSPMVAFQILMRTMSMQMENGSWANSPEVTAYAILTLKKMASLPWNGDLRVLVTRSIRNGTDYLQKNESRWDTPESLLWIEKVSYSSKILSQTYCLAAIVTASSLYQWKGKVPQLFSAFALGGGFDAILPSSGVLSACARGL